MRTLPIASLVLVAVHAIAVARPAFAQSAPSPAATAATAAPAGDVIHLKNGGQLRGTIVDVIPGSHARIQLATGEVATIPWADIARVESASRPSTAPAPAPTPTPAAPEPQKLVHIDAPRQVALERQTANPKVWIEVCQSPCDKRVPASGNYRIGGSGVRASRTFVLDAGTEDRVFIEVDPGSKGWFVGGIVITSLGGATMLIGLMLAAIGSAASSSFSTHDNSLTTAGLTTAAVGALVAVGGLVALTSNSSSTATRTSVPSTAAGGNDVSKRAPTWTSSPTLGATTPIVLPVFTATF